MCLINTIVCPLAKFGSCRNKAIAAVLLTFSIRTGVGLCGISVVSIESV